MKVCFGGTFNILHKGHQYLIDTAFQIAGENGEVLIGLTKGPLTKNKKQLQSYNKRKEQLKIYLTKRGYISQVNIVPIKDKYGPSIEVDYDAIVVSSETRKNAEEINEIRIKNNKKLLKIIEIPLVLAEDKKPISSSRIINEEIDENGRII